MITHPRRPAELALAAYAIALRVLISFPGMAMAMNGFAASPCTHIKTLLEIRK